MPGTGARDRQQKIRSERRWFIRSFLYATWSTGVGVPARTDLPKGCRTACVLYERGSGMVFRGCNWSHVRTGQPFASGSRFSSYNVTFSPSQPSKSDPKVIHPNSSWDHLSVTWRVTIPIAHASAEATEASSTSPQGPSRVALAALLSAVRTGHLALRGGRSLAPPWPCSPCRSRARRAGHEPRATARSLRPHLLQQEHPWCRRRRQASPAYADCCWREPKMLSVSSFESILSRWIGNGG